MSFLDELRKIPPVTRFLCGSTLAISLPVMLQLVSPYTVVFVREFVTIRLEVWRLYTSLFYAGSGINFLFDIIMLYRNSDTLESTHFSGKSADYAWQLLLSAVGILGLNLPLRSALHFRPLVLSLVYLSSRLSPSSMVSIFGLLQIPNTYFPYALLALDLIMGGPRMAACSVTGLIVGHAWWMLFHDEQGGRPGGSFGTAPGWLKAMFGDGSVVPPVAAAAGDRVSAAATRAAAAAQRANPASGSGYNWGGGNRLGSG